MKNELKITLIATTILLVLTPLFVKIANIGRGYDSIGGGELLFWLVPFCIYSFVDTKRNFATIKMLSNK